MGAIYQNKLGHLQRLQERACMLIEGSKIKDGWSCHWFSVSNLIKLDRTVMIFKITNGLYPDKMKGRLVTRFHISTYSSRNSLHLNNPRQNLEFSKRSFFHSGAQTWNEISQQIRMSSTITTITTITMITTITTFKKVK